MPNSLETRFERVLLMSRWLLVPIYLVVLLLLIGFAFKAILELVHLFGSLMSISETDLVLAALSLIDLALVGDLAVMVALSGYETMVSRIDATPEMEKPNWLGKYDSGTIKLKVASSLVAISAIHLLKTYWKATFARCRCCCSSWPIHRLQEICTLSAQRVQIHADLLNSAQL